MARCEVYRGRVIEELSSVLTPGAMGQYFSLDCLHSENRSTTVMHLGLSVCLSGCVIQKLLLRLT